MEEILASIRRIIEDNENTRPDDHTSEPTAISSRDMAREASSRETSMREASVIEVDAFRSDLRASRPVEARSPRADESLQDFSEHAAARWVADDERVAELQVSQSQRPAAANVRPSEPAPKHEALRPSTPAKRPAPVQSPSPVATQGVQAILSEQAGRKVAASFGELSDALAARGRQSLDEMAAEMLRPMLQDWLDNNLPTLVEKLVREEIERVARGA